MPTTHKNSHPSTSKLCVVTGSTGHLGGTLIRQLLAKGHRVRAVVFTAQQSEAEKARGPTGTATLDSLACPALELVPGDVRDIDSLRLAFEGADWVFHLAAVISIIGDLGGLVQEINVKGTENVADACLDCDVKRMVHVSSIHAFQMEPKDQKLDEARARIPASGGRFNAYDRSKSGGEMAVRARIEKGLDVVILHPTGVMGPFDLQPSRVGAMWLDIAHKKMPMVIEGGFNWVDSRDVCTSIRKAAEIGECGQSYILGGHQKSIRDVVDTASEILHQKSPKLVCPMWLAKLSAPTTEFFAKRFSKQPLYTHESLEALCANRHMCSDLATSKLEHRTRAFQETVHDCFRSFVQQGTLPKSILQHEETTDAISIF